MRLTKRQLRQIIREALDGADLAQNKQYQIGMRGHKDLPRENVTGKNSEILSANELQDFHDWIEDGNAAVDFDGTYREQTTQWRKKFTLKELQKFFKNEYLQ